MTDFEKKLVEDKVEELLKVLQESFQHSAGDTLHEEVKFLRDNPSNVKFSAIGYDDGMLNYIYRVKDLTTNKSVLLKWARLCPRIQEVQDVGLTEEEYDLKQIRERNPIECNALKLFEKFVPGSTPKLLYEDSARFFFVMEDLFDYTSLKDQLDTGNVIPEVFAKITKFLSDLHRKTHVKTLSPEDFKQLEDYIGTWNSELNKGIIKWFFEECFKDPNRCRKTVPLEKVIPQIINNDELRPNIQQMGHRYKTEHVCLLHNDAHPGFAMANKYNHDVKIIDAEICRLSYPAKEIGYFIGEVLLWYYVHLGRGRHEVCQQIKNCVYLLVTDYMVQMQGLLEDDFITWVAGMAGLVNCCRTINFIPFPPFEGLEQAEADCVQAAVHLIKNMQDINTIDKFIATAFQNVSST